MKKLISMALAVAMLFSMTAAYVSADALVSYTAGFETGEDISWLNSNTGSAKTKAYGSNSANTAFEFTDANSKVGTASYDGIIGAPVKNHIIFSFDFYADGTTWNDDPAHTAGQIQPRLYFNTKGSTYVWKTIIRSGVVEFSPQVYTDSSAAVTNRNDFSDIPYDTWARLILVYDSTTGKGDYSVVYNVDTDDATVETKKGYDIATANVDTLVNRFYIDSDRSDGTSYIDNVVLREIPAVLAQTAATPATGAADAAVADGLSFTFNTDIDRVQLKINGSKASFAVNGNQITYSDTLEENTSYTVTGFVADVYGQVLQVNHTFTTAAAVSGGDTPEEDTLIKHETDFETVESYSWADACTGSTETLAYGTNSANTAYKLSNNTRFGSLSYASGTNLKQNPVTGLSIFTCDFYPESTSFADDEDDADYNFANIYTDSHSGLYVWKFIKRSNQLGVVPMGNFGGPEVRVDFDTWTRLVLVYNPTTGLGDFTVIENVDTASTEVTTFTGIQVTNADQTKIDRMFLYSYRSNTVYADNVSIRQLPAVLTVENVRFVDANDNKVTDGVSIAAPTYKATVTNNTDAPEKVTVVVTATKAGRIEEIAMETVTVAAGATANIAKHLTDTDVSDCDIKGFLIRLQNIRPFTDAITLEAR